MTKKLILVSHGNFCHELKKSTEMIMGPQDDLISIGLEAEEAAEDFKAKFLKEVQNLSDSDFIVCADLMGGTPCNVLSRLIMEGRQFELYAGMNMPMVIGFLNSQLLEQAVELKEFACQNIHKVNDLLQSMDEDDDEL
ncbi:PTS sugar transporter subunit IIA [Streptococcus catagoni]|uniref:PTS sugar transporter subunit IIA n=1 Tax=Streptococcus catagoni TaxID=2654874 RepID=UPI00140A0E32|nr:PTS fructose transporter subunit IIA [Streptococcus catagoni]